MDYQIVSSFSVLEIEKSVRSYIKIGYKPLGGLCFNSETKEYHQAMISKY